MKENQDNSNKIYCFLYVLIAAATMLPLTCGYIMQGGIIEEWIMRVQEISLFPHMETVLSVNSRINALHSNLWFLPFSLFYAITNKLKWSYLLQMFFIQTGTLFSSYLMFHRLFSEFQKKQIAFFGVILYMTCPYRLYCCYDRADLFQAAAWMLVPIYIWSVAGIIKKGKWTDIFVAAFALAGIGYANIFYFLMSAGFSVLAIFFIRCRKMALSLIGGCILFIPGLLRLIQYLFTDKYDVFQISLQSIMPAGYRLGYYFEFFVYHDGRPGMGFGLFFALLSAGWLILVEKKWEKSKVARIFSLFGIIIFFLSLKYFPWDYVQRVGSPLLKLVGLIGTPAIFGGAAQLLFCIPGAYSIYMINKIENRYAARGIVILFVSANLLWCIYFCNMLTYQRIPY